MRSAIRSSIVGLAATLVLAGAPATAPAAGPLQATAGRPALKSLDRLADLRASFNRDHGQLRLVLLLSPT